MQLAGTAIVSVLIALPVLYTSLGNFFQSNRVSAVSEQTQSVLGFYSVSYLISFVGRFFSNNILGVGNEYSGAYNYYEVAMLSTSLLVGIAVIYLLQTKYKKRVCILMLLSGASLIFPVVTYIMNFDINKQRWTFMLCFLAVLAIGYFLQDFFEKKIPPRQLMISLLIADVLYLLAGVGLVAAHYKKVIDLDGKSCLIVAVIGLLYNVFFVGTIWKKGKYQALLIGLIVVEIVSANYATINQRDLVSVSDLQNGYYNDGTSEAVNYIALHDETLFRTNKTYMSVGYNDSQAQNYYGMAVYSATNSNAFINFFDENNVLFLSDQIEMSKSGQKKHLSVPYERYYFNSLLGVKYILSKTKLEDESFYTFSYKFGDIYVYQNEHSVTFGYLYSTEYTKDSLNELIDATDRDMCLTTGFYYTDTSNELTNAVDAGVMTEEEALAGLEELQQNGIQDATFENGTLTGTISNSSEEEQMLCIPIIYSDDWSLYVDGEEVEISNINGGLIGAWISSGDHSIKLTYAEKKALFYWISIGTYS